MKNRNWWMRTLAPAGEAHGAGGGDDDDTAVLDRGDDFTPTGDDAQDDLPAAGGEAPEGGKQGLRAAGEELEEGEGEGEEDKPAGKEAKGEEEEKDGKRRSEPRIPLKRHKEVLERERSQRESLERKLAQYERGDRIAATNEDIKAREDAVLELEKRYTKLMTDGESERAAEAMAQIRRAEREIAQMQTRLEVEAAEARAVEQARFDIVVERLEAAYPVLNPEHDDYDKAVVAEVLELQRGYQLQNYPPAAALQKAVKYVLRTDSRKQEEATGVKPRVDKEALAAERAADARRKAAEAAGKSAPPLRTGLDSDKAGRGARDGKDIMKMSQEEFAQLDEAELSRLRGDEL